MEISGTGSLALFAYLLTFIEGSAAGRTYAAYGGIYILSSLLWLWIVENQTPTRWDLFGAAICLLGSTIILLGSRVHE